MDGVSIAASIIGIATAGVQVSIKLVTLATQISTSSDRVSAIGNDISLTSSVLRQLGDLLAQKTTDGDICILNKSGLESTKTAAAMCEKIFSEIETELKKASEQVRRYKPGIGKMRGQKIELSKTEQAKWPFLQPRIDGLRTDLRDAKSTLILLLQLATLALNKRMADASLSASELQDSLRAIVAVELERREGRTNPIEPPKISSSSGSIKSTDIGMGNTTPPRPETLSPHPYLYQIASPDDNQSRGLQPSNVPSFSVARPPGLNDPPTVGHAAPECGKQTQSTHNSKLQLFLLKPIVKDLFDRIELRWTVQDTNMPPQLILDDMNQDEKIGIPSVVEMLQQLHAFEQGIVDTLIPKDSGRSILSLKRTTIDIRSRDMLFKAVPGLQFVVQCPARQSQPQNPFTETYSDQISVTHDVRPDLRAGVEYLRRGVGGVGGGRGSYDTTGLPKPKPPPRTQAEDQDAIQKRLSVEDSPPESLASENFVEFEGENEDDFKLSAQPVVSHCRCLRRYREGESEVDFDPSAQAEAVPDEEAEAEAMVNGLLKQYTTLFNP